jgi:hypothetical protein
MPIVADCNHLPSAVCIVDKSDDINIGLDTAVFCFFFSSCFFSSFFSSLDSDLDSEFDSSDLLSDAGELSPLSDEDCVSFELAGVDDSFEPLTGVEVAELDAAELAELLAAEDADADAAELAADAAALVAACATVFATAC